MKKRSLRTPFDFIARSQFLHSSRQRTRRSTGNSIIRNAEGKHATSLGQTQATKEERIPFTQPVALERREAEKTVHLSADSTAQHFKTPLAEGSGRRRQIDSERRQRDKLARTLGRMYKSNKSYKSKGIKKKKKGKAKRMKIK